MRKVFLITGASSDLAMEFIRQIDEKLSSEDECIIYGTYNSSDTALDKLQTECKYVEIRPIKCNLLNSDDILQSVNIISEEKPQYFIHLAAAKIEYMRIRDFNWEKTKQELDIQVGGFANLCKALLPIMYKQGFGRIIAIGSASTFGVPPKYMSDYIITKYALYGLVKSIASEYSGKNVTCNMISPDMIETKFLSNLDKRTAEINAKQSAMKRNVTVGEVASSIRYLCSNDAAYITGTNLNISGGNFM